MQLLIGATYVCISNFSGPGRNQQTEGGKNQDQNRTDIRIKLERPHDHKSSSVSLVAWSKGEFRQ